MTLLIFSSCDSTKFLTDGQELYNGSEIRFEDESKFDDQKALTFNLEELVTPAPNSGFFKTKLWIYNHTKTPKKEKGIRNWLKYKIGEKPVLYDESKQENNRLKISKYLKDVGYISSTVQYDTIRNAKKVNGLFTISSTGCYTIRKVEYSKDTTDIANIFRSNQANSHLQAGMKYDKDNIDLERARLTDVATNEGYLEFNTDYIYFYVDTIPNLLEADIYVEIKSQDDKSEYKRYSIGKTKVFTTFDLGQREVAKQDTIISENGTLIIGGENVLRPNVLDRLIIQDEADFISKKFMDRNVGHLLDLGIFKFVNLKNVVQAGSDSLKVDREFYLTQSIPENVSAEFELTNRTGNFFGTGATFSYTHKNLFKGAERLQLSISGGIETQLNNVQSFINTADFTATASLSIPKFITPFKWEPISRYYLTYTNFSLSNNYQIRSEFYTINSTNFSFGYKWKEPSRNQHELNPIFLNRVQVFNTTATFDSILIANTRLAGSFENNFIGGAYYAYIFNSRKENNSKYRFYFKPEIEVAGNLLTLINGGSSQGNNKATFFGSPIAQYIRTQVDLRYYRLFDKSKFAFRFAPGLGFAYGNSDLLPYIKQFYVGGANSIRAFRIRQLGPGPTLSVSNANNQFLDQTGDIKLELSAEYRFDIYGYLKGAVFVDAGNVWLLNDDSNSTVGFFDLDSFVNEIAVGTGFGLRFDIDFIVVRLDASFPIRRPVNNQFDWTVNSVQITNTSWLKDNVVYNLAIGYPF